MNRSSKYGFYLPQNTDPISVSDFNYNFELIDNNLITEEQSFTNTQKSTARSNIGAVSESDVSPRIYYNEFTRNTTNTTWMWGSSYIYRIVHLVLFTAGISIASAANDFVEIGTISSSFRPAAQFRGSCTTQDGGDAKMVIVETDGKVKIYKPEAKTYYFELAWVTSLANV